MAHGGGELTTSNKPSGSAYNFFFTYQLPKKQWKPPFQCHRHVTVCHSLSPVMEHLSSLSETEKINLIAVSINTSMLEVCCLIGWRLFNLLSHLQSHLDVFQPLNTLAYSMLLFSLSDNCKFYTFLLSSTKYHS